MPSIAHHDVDVHMYKTSGARTAAFPLKTHVDTETAQSTNDAYNDAGTFFSNTSRPRLLAIYCLGQTPTGAATVAVISRAASPVTWYTFTFDSVAADKCKIFPGGLPLPVGGFGLTTSSDNWLLLFTDYRS